MSGLRKSRPESPEIMSRFLVWFRAGDRMHLISAWIKCTCDPFPIQAVMQGIQLLLQMTQFFLVFFLGDFLVQFHLGQLRHLHQREYILQNGHSKALILHGHMDTAA